MKRLLFALLAAAIAASPSGAETPTSKRIAFTYDDGPMADGPFFTGAERTERLIAALEEGGVAQAAFFMTTRNLLGDGEHQRVREYAAAGHVIANHSHEHRWLHRIGAEAYIADLDKAEAMLAGFDNRRAWFRFPYLDEGRDEATRDAVREALKERGLKSGYVTVDTFDWHMNNLAAAALAEGKCVDQAKMGAIYVEMFVDAAEHFHALALEAMGRAPAQVILLHENDIAALYAADLAAGLRDKGWEIVTADEAFADPIAEIEPATLFSGQGRVAALAKEAGVGHDRIDHDASEEAPINARFEQAGVIAACEGGGP